MNYLESGINSIKSKKYDEAFSLLEKGFFENGEVKAGAYLSMMYNDTKITPRTDEALITSMLLWYATKDEIPSSVHKLGVTLYGNKSSQAARTAGLNMIYEGADRGYTVSYCVLGVLEYAKKNYEKAISYFEKYDNLINDKKACGMYVASHKDFSKDISKQAWTIFAEYANRYADDIWANSDAYKLLFEKDCAYPSVMPLERQIEFAERFVIQ